MKQKITSISKIAASLTLLMIVCSSLFVINADSVSAQSLGPTSIFPPPVSPGGSGSTGSTGSSGGSGIPGVSGGSGSGSQTGSSQTQSDVPPISDCNNSTDPAACKKAYRKCDRLQGPNIGPAVARCKKDVINKFKKSSTDPSKKSPGGKKKKGKGGAGGTTGDGAVGSEGTYQCGNLPNDSDNFKTKLDFGCLGTKGPVGLGPIQDLAFALIRFASIGVGIVVTIATIAAGVQYSMAEGNPEASHKAKVRAREALIGLMVYIFAFSILQFLIPGGIFK